MIARLATVLLLLISCCGTSCALAGSRPEGTPAADPAAVIVTVVPALPVLPEMALHHLLTPVVAYSSVQTRQLRGKLAQALTSLPESPSAVSELVDQLPWAGRIHRRAGQRFNTSDGSSVDAFAICYRMTRRIGMQIIPGDPAPVKLAVSSLSNNSGVTVGMTLRLSH